MVPPRPPHPRRGHNPRLPDRQILDGILLMYRSRCRWADLPRLGLCSASPAFRRLREWSDAGSMAALRDLHDPELDALGGPGWIGPTRRVRPPGLRE